MARFGTDKPDLRFGMEITDVSDLVAESDFGVFKNTRRRRGARSRIDRQGRR